MDGGARKMRHWSAVTWTIFSSAMLTGIILRRLPVKQGTSHTSWLSQLATTAAVASVARSLRHVVPASAHYWCICHKAFILYVYACWCILCVCVCVCVCAINKTLTFSGVMWWSIYIRCEFVYVCVCMMLSVSHVGKHMQYNTYVVCVCVHTYAIIIIC